MGSGLLRGVRPTMTRCGSCGRLENCFNRFIAARRAHSPEAVNEAWQARAYKMNAVKVVIWEEDGGWLGYLQEYPDYWTQGETREELKEHLLDLYGDITRGAIPGIRKVEELVVP
jgi:hypothetical protein